MENMKKILVAVAITATLSGCLVSQNDAVRSLSYSEVRKAIPIG